MYINEYVEIRKAIDKLDVDESLKEVLYDIARYTENAKDIASSAYDKAYGYDDNW